MRSAAVERQRRSHPAHLLCRWGFSRASAAMAVSVVKGWTSHCHRSIAANVSTHVRSIGAVRRGVMKVLEVCRCVGPDPTWCRFCGAHWMACTCHRCVSSPARAVPGYGEGMQGPWCLHETCLARALACRSSAIWYALSSAGAPDARRCWGRLERF